MQSIRGGLSDVALSFLGIVQQGRSWSGRERNCGFLNTGPGDGGGGGRFANLSSAAGVDFPDDGRGLAQVDWDLDGDLDLWTSNRTAPQLRFLRNGDCSGHAFLALRLEGRRANRDGIGARVTYHPEAAGGGGPAAGGGGPGRAAAPQFRTLRAGDGFLSQSSKWLHFGLGDAATAGPGRVLVRWPGGDEEFFNGLEPNRRYRLVEGTGSAERWVPPRTAGQVKLTHEVFEETPSAGPARVFSVTGLPLPRLGYRDFAGADQTVAAGTAGGPAAPVLLNLWASWCAPCRGELKAFARHREAFRSAGLAVVALSVDALDGRGADGPEAAREAAQKALRGAGFPEGFRAGMAAADIPEKLQIAADTLLDIHLPLPVPSSVLIDPAGRVAALYRGPVEPALVLADLKRIGLAGEARRAASLPFRGRWFAPLRQLHLFPYALRLAESGFFEDAAEMIRRYEHMLLSHSQAAKLLLVIGRGLESGGRPGEALPYYRDAVARQPRYSQALTALARVLAAHPDPSVRNGTEAVRLASLAASLTKNRDAEALDALAAAYAETGFFDLAASTAERALQAAERQASGASALAQEIRRRAEGYRGGRAFRLGDR